jgi:hypothetical protein
MCVLKTDGGIAPVRLLLYTVSPYIYQDMLNEKSDGSGPAGKSHPLLGIGKVVFSRIWGGSIASGDTSVAAPVAAHCLNMLRAHGAP